MVIAGLDAVEVVLTNPILLARYSWVYPLSDFAEVLAIVKSVVPRYTDPIAESHHLPCNSSQDLSFGRRFRLSLLTHHCLSEQYIQRPNNSETRTDDRAPLADVRDRLGLIVDLLAEQIPLSNNENGEDRSGEERNLDVLADERDDFVCLLHLAESDIITAVKLLRVVLQDLHPHVDEQEHRGDATCSGQEHSCVEAQDIWSGYHIDVVGL